MFYFVRRKRAADSGSTNNDVGLDSAPRISIDRITSNDSAGPVPDAPLHQYSVFPTPMNITEQMAIDLCLGAIERTELYQTCLNYTAADTEDYIQSCVDDIKVICVVCLLPETTWPARDM